MACEGCSGAVNRILGKIDGIEEVKIDMEGQKVHVTHSDKVDPEDMLGKLKKWGDAANKTVELAED
jgi:copper chaperone